MLQDWLYQDSNIVLQNKQYIINTTYLHYDGT